MFSRFLNGLDDPREYYSLIACAVLCAAYIAILLIFRFTGTPVDTVFLAHRQHLLFQKALRFPLPQGVPVNVIDHGHLIDSVVLVDGWSAPEPAGVWTDGPTAKFAFSLPTNLWANAYMQIWVTIATPTSGTQVVLLRVGDQMVGSWQLRIGDAVLCVALPHATELRHNIARAEFDIGSPTSPPDGLDPRQLGLNLKRAEILRSKTECEADADR